MTLKLHDADPYLLDFDATVVARAMHEGRPALVLDRTAFYAESGGQPWDLGVLGGVPVTAVLDDGGRVLHVLERALCESPQGRVHGSVDGPRRRDHRQQHHGQHLLSRALLESCGARTVGFHLGAEAVTIDLDRALAPDELQRGVRLANDVVLEARPVRVQTVTRAEAAALGCQVPEQAGDEVRLVEAEGFDRQPCSGTHPRHTGEVGPLVVLRAERYKGATRVAFVCGERALRAVEARFGVLDELSGLLSAPWDGLAPATRRTLDELVATRRRGDELLARALRGEARELLAHATPAELGVPLVAAALDARPVAELRALALEITALAACVALLGTRGDAAQLVFARTPGGQADLSAALRAALAVLGGRGGGRGDLVQGGGPAVDRLDEALAAARAALAPA